MMYAILQTMTFNDQILEVESRAKAVGLGIGALCDASGINRATWQRWKAGKTSPTMKNWFTVLSVVRSAESEHFARESTEAA